jgi:hypothetical protein
LVWPLAGPWPIHVSTKFGGQTIVGGSQSFTVTVNVQLDVLPEASVAVTVTVEVPTGKAEPEAGLATTLKPAQLSVPVATKFTTAEHWPGALHTVTLAGHCTVGFSQSFTVTVKEHCWLLPEASVAVTTTVVVPIGKVEPEAGLATTVGAPQLSAPVAVKFTTAPQLPASAHVVTFAGHWTVGASQSVIVTVNEQVEVRPAASVATTLTVVVPSGKVEPEAGVATALLPEQLSVEPTLNVTTAPQEPASAHWLIAVGQVATGSSQSLTVTVKEPLVTLPAASVTEAFTVVVPTGKTEPEAGLADTV